MPRLDGLSFLKRLMQFRPTPVVMISALTTEGADSTLQALEMGAVDFFCKPKLDREQEWLALRNEVIAKVKAATLAYIRIPPTRTPKPREMARAAFSGKSSCSIVAIGASTGGVGALMEVLEPLPTSMPPVLVVQHMPTAFIKQFVKRLNSCCALTVQEAANGEVVQNGHVYVAPGDRHLFVERSGSRLQCRLEVGEKVNGHIPSADKLFNSIAVAAGQHAIGLLLTGMGRDGAYGLREMRRAGATTACQDEKSCIVYGMPRAAMEIGAAAHELPLNRIAPFLIEQSVARPIALSSGAAPSPPVSRLRIGSSVSHPQSHPRETASPAIGSTGSNGRSTNGIQFNEAKTVWVAPADFYVTSSATEVLSTILGSCIAVCIRDPVVRCGGMNHFVLPSLPEPSNGLPSVELRYGSYSIERLINAVLSRGGQRDRLEIKIFGGSNVLGTSNIGHNNADFVESYLEKEGLPVAAKDLRGTAPRRIHYSPSTGQALVSRPRDSAAARRIDEETQNGIRRILITGPQDAEIFTASSGTARDRSKL
jgi:two-component system chemotaxis response regulator CheB